MAYMLSVSARKRDVAELQTTGVVALNVKGPGSPSFAIQRAAGDAFDLLVIDRRDANCEPRSQCVLTNVTSNVSHWPGVRGCSGFRCDPAVIDPMRRSTGLLVRGSYSIWTS